MVSVNDHCTVAEQSPKNRLSFERNVQHDIAKYLMASECDKQPSPNNQFH